MEINKIYCGDCLKIVENIDDNSIDASIIDPPYGVGMDIKNDNNLQTSTNLLEEYLKKIEPKLKSNSHIAIFWTIKDLDECLDIVRYSGFLYRRILNMYIPKGNARPYLGWLPRTQAIVICQKYLPKKPFYFHKDLAIYLSKYINQSKYSKSEIAKYLKVDSRLIMKWSRIDDPAWCLPTKFLYSKLKTLLQMDDEFDILLNREDNKYINNHFKHDTYIINNKKTQILHPCQKPLEVLEHIVNCITTPGQIVIDGFCGSGTTLLACKNLNRNYIGIDIEQKYCDISDKRLKEIDSTIA